MPETTNLVTPAAVATAVISLAAALRTRYILKKTQEANNNLAVALMVNEHQRSTLSQMIADRNIKPTKEEAEKLTSLI